MIKFFRKIRQNLLSEGKTGTYFKYAIGEIFLVVIGILIALYLNNLSEQHKIYKQQKNHLMLIKEEMTSNLNSLDIERKELSTLLDFSKKIINSMNSDTKINKLKESEMSEIMARLIGWDIEVFQANGALNQLVASGELKNIENDDIRGILASWGSKIEAVKLQEKQLALYIFKIKEYIGENGDYKRIMDDIGYSKDLKHDLSKQNNSNKHLLKSKRFENVILLFSGTAATLNFQIYPNYEREIKYLIELIDQYNIE